MNPFFSISVPTLGKLDQWKLALQSVLDQTYKDFEIIIINDGSNDQTQIIADKLAGDDDRIKVINH